MAIEVLSTHLIYQDGTTGEVDGGTIQLTEAIQPYDTILLVQVGLNALVQISMEFHSFYTTALESISLGDGYRVASINASYATYFSGTGNDEIVYSVQKTVQATITHGVFYARLMHIRGASTVTSDWTAISDSFTYTVLEGTEECVADTEQEQPRLLQIELPTTGYLVVTDAISSFFGSCTEDYPELSYDDVDPDDFTPYPSAWYVGKPTGSDDDGILSTSGTLTLGYGFAASAVPDTQLYCAVVALAPAYESPSEPVENEYSRIGQYAAEMRCLEEVDILSGGSPSISSTKAKTGSYSYLMQGSDSVGIDFGKSVSRLRCATHFFSGISGITYPIWLNSDSEAETDVTFGVKLDLDLGQVSLIVDSSVVDISTPSIDVLRGDRWFHWAVTYDGPNGLFNVWCDDELLFEYSGSFTYETLERSMSGSPSAISGDEYSDNFYIDEAFGTVVMRRPPYKYFRFGLTDGPGSHAGFTVNGDTPNWRCVDDPAAHDGDSTTNTAEDGGLIDTFTIEELLPLTPNPNTIINIAAVIPQAIIKADEVSGDFGINLLLYDGEELSVSEAIVNIDTDYEMVSYRFEEQPDGEGWDLDSVNAMHYGYVSIGLFGETHHLSGSVSFVGVSMNFDPYVVASSTGFWTITDGFSTSANSFSHTISASNDEDFAADWTNATDVTRLRMPSDEITVIDVTQLTALVEIDLGNNHLTSIDVSNNSSMDSLELDHNELTSLDVSNMTVLTELWLQNNSLSTLNISGITTLQYIDLSFNNLTSIDLSPMSSLIEAYLTDGDFTSITLPTSSSLDYLDISGNSSLTSIDLSNQSDLTRLYAFNDGLTALVTSACTLLERLYAYNCDSLTSLDLSSNTALTDVQVNGCALLASINVSNLSNVGEFYGHECPSLTSFDATDMSSLYYLNLDDCSSLASLDLTGVPVHTVYARNGNLNQTAVDNVLCALDTTGETGSYYVNLVGNAIPGSTGLTCKTSLEGKGWTVLVQT